MEERINVLSAGERFTFKGFKWVTLGQADGGVFAIMADIWKNMCFRSDDVNYYEISEVRKALIEELLPILGEDNLLPHTVDLLSDNGDDSYGTVTDKVFILSCDEYRKYKKSMPKYDNWIWTCTPWYIYPDCGTGDKVRVIYATGGFAENYADGSCGVVPACIFNPKNLKLRRQAHVVEI